MSDDEKPAPDPDAPQALETDKPSEAAGAPRPSEAEAGPAPAEEAEGGFIVGIGASAGGLEALSELLRHAPSDNMSFIVVQHLAPDHESVLPQLLARGLSLRVLTATDGATIEPGCVYVIPPNADLAILQRVIRVMTPEGGYGPRLPVDYMFRSLAQDQGHRAIGIVLSGTGTDGTLGIQAIKAAGGFTFVQDPSTAKYDGMPRSALATGAADYCLPLKEIGQELARIAKQPRSRSKERQAAPAPATQDQLAKLFVLVRSEFGNDLTQYKSSTIDRRIERRMTLHRMGRLDHYVRYVQQHRDELHALYKDMLITVTSFFRDPEAFDALKSGVLPRLMEGKDASKAIRVWVPACASGEEAYSIAICLIELCEDKGWDERIQIFGTDIDEDSIQHARRGVYPANIALDVSPERLHRFFVKKDDEFHVSRRVRDTIVFSRQNVLKDAPFSRIDLVSCRNLLIYLQPSAQKKVLRVLHYALNPQGYLMLGTSETVGDAPELFSTVDRKNKIYAKKPVVPQASFDLSLVVPPPEPAREVAAVRPALNLQSLADRKVLDLYGPAGVVVNESLDVLQFRGDTGPYLDPAPGTASFNILRMTRFELHIELKNALQKALAEHVRVTAEVSYHEHDKPALVRLDVVPLQDPETKTRYVLVLFHPMPEPKEVPVAALEATPAGEAPSPLGLRIQELERELAVTKEYLQATIEERESTLEELKSANEELQSSNEELQSTNEELETSKEEMESTNEELTTVNDELQSRMTELSLTNDDLHNVLTGVDNAVVIVGMDLRIRRFTGAAERLFHLVPADVGRSIGFLDSFLGTGVIEPKVADVIQTLSTLEEDFLASNQRWYTLKINPYRTLDHSIRGALVTLTDIDVRKRTAEMTRDVTEYAAKFLSAIGHPLLIVDRKLRIVWANDVFLSAFQLAAEETLGSTLATLGARQLADPVLRERIEGVFSSASVLRDVQVRVRSPEGTERTMRIGASQIPASSDRPLVLLSIELNGRSP